MPAGVTVADGRLPKRFDALTSTDQNAEPVTMSTTSRPVPRSQMNALPDAAPTSEPSDRQRSAPVAASNTANDGAAEGPADPADSGKYWTTTAPSTAAMIRPDGT